MKNLALESEKAVQEAFILREKGHSLPMITAIFPKHKDEIKAAFHTAAMLRDNGELLSPRPESLLRALEALKEVEKTPAAIKAKKIAAVASKPKRMAIKSPMLVFPSPLKVSLSRFWKITLPACALLAVLVFAFIHKSPSSQLTIKAQDIVQAYEEQIGGADSVATNDDTVVNNFYSDIMTDGTSTPTNTI